MNEVDRDAGDMPSARARTAIVQDRASAVPSPKRIELRAPAIVRAYVAALARKLEERGHRVTTVVSPDAQTPGSIDWLLYFESLAYRMRSESFAPCVAPKPGPATACDIVIDLAGDAGDSAVPALRLIFDAGAGEAGMLNAVLASRWPGLTIALTQAGEPPRTLRKACLAVERPQVLGVALDDVTARLATLIVQAAENLDVHHEACSTVAERVAPMLVSPFGYAAKALAERIDRKLTVLLKHPREWRIALRVNDGPGVMERRDWSGPAWRVMPDDGQRYFADPFLFEHHGDRWLFCEEFPFATGKGILSVARVEADGAIGAARPIIETDGHLSWPQVFAHDGQIYMVPESATAGRIDLWRAVDFPTKWVRDGVLIDGIRAHDPVVHLAETGAFILATVNDDGGSSFDALSLFHAPHLLGDWRANPDNPLIVDASSVRGAGPIVARGGDLWRATQDCRTGYGDGLVLCRVTRLDAGGFSQDVVARLGAPPDLDASGVHTLSRVGDLEAIDVRGVERTLLRA